MPCPSRRPSLFVLPSTVLVLFLMLALAARAQAQGDPPVGVRAAGMAGAFTAVADDASATVWNPAGLASGSFFSVAVDGSRFDAQNAQFVGVATPPLGLTYYRSATGGVGNSRNSLVAHNFGVSLVQSLGDTGVAVGTTLKWIHGVTSSPDAASLSANKFDADLGVMVSGGLGQVGLTVRNLVQPSFEVPGGASTIRLDRKVRGGVAIHLAGETKIAGDVEFTKATTASGVWRDAAVGVESHPLERAWFRGGLHWNTAGGGPGGTGAAPIAAFGASYTIRGGFAADAQASVGSARGNRGWGVGARMAF